MRKCIELLSASVLSSCLFSSFSFAGSLTEAINKTLVEHPQAQAGFSRYKAEMEGVNAAWGSWLPSIDFAMGIGGQKKDYPDEHANNTDENSYTRKEASFSLKQNLFSGFNTSNSVDEARYKASAEYLRLRNTLQDLALKVIDAYLKVLEYRDLVELSEENLKVHNSIFNQISKRASQGVARQSDLSQIDGRVARANANVVSAHNNLMDAESNYFSLVGEMPGDIEQPGSYRLELYETFEAALDMAVKHHPSIQATALDIKASESRYSSVKSSYLPTVDIELDQSWKNNADSNLGHHKDTTAMVRLRYNLFRGGTDEARVQESAHRTEESRSERDRILRSVEESLRLAWAAYEFLGEQKQYLQQHKQASNKTVAAYREQFNIGKRTLLDLLDSENELFQASKNLSSSSYQEAFARYRVIQGTGELLNKLNFSLPESWKKEDH